MEREKPRWGGNAILAVAVVLMLLLIYVLSIGPADILRAKGFIPVRAFVVFYHPLGFLCTHCAPFERFLAWYLSLFR